MAKESVAIIGGGVSGMVAAIYAKRAGADVSVFELNNKLGKKILKTGGGRCNFANEDTRPVHYHSKNPEYVKKITQKYNLEDLIEFMKETGIWPKSVDGWIYPYSMQAKSVRDCLSMEVYNLGCKVYTETKVNGIKPESKGFILDTSKGVMRFDGCIMACGGMACPESGSDGNGFVMAKGLGLEIKPVFAALSPIVCSDKYLKKASGIRTDAKVSLIIDGESYSESGNLQITDFGISGICTMQLSYLAAVGLHEKKTVYAKLDFVPDIKKNELKNIIIQRFEKNGAQKNCADALTGLVPDKLISAILNSVGIRPDAPARSLDSYTTLIDAMKEYTTSVVDVKGFSQAQSTYGGVSLSELDKNTLLSKKYPNLGFCGEILDVCGDCGGYNIMWAISSGAVVGSCIMKGL